MAQPAPEAPLPIISLADIEPPLRVDAADRLSWDDEADLVVVGFGAAGASAAIQARENGADVVVIDRFEGGGASAYSAGVVYAGATRFQRDAGIDDSAEEMAKYIMMECGDAVRPDTVRRYCEQSAANVEWLAHHGVPFKGVVHPGKIAYPDNDKGLYHSGNELVPAVTAVSKSAPRGHRTMGKGWTGYVLFAAIRAAAQRVGVRFRFHNRAMRLVLDAHDRVIGVETLEVRPDARKLHQKLYDVVQPLKPFNTRRALAAIARTRDIEAGSSTRKLIRARSGVVLATGGYNYNLSMISQYMPAIAKAYGSIMVLGSAGCDGSGIELGLSVGGSTAKLQNMCLGRALARPTALLHGILVNVKGERFVNEDAYPGTIGDALAQQPEGESWLVVDQETYRRLLRQCIPDGTGGFRNFGAPLLLNILFGGTRKGATLAALSRKCGFEPDRLEREIEDVNAALDAGQIDRVGKAREASHRFGKGPYRAINYAIKNRFGFIPFFTISGLNVDQDNGGVLSADDGVIEGLYAAGRAAMGLCSNNYVSGLSLADCIFSGRRAANAATGKEGISEPAPASESERNLA